MAEGIEDGKIQMLIELVNDRMLSIQTAASKACISEEEFLKKMQ